VLCGVLLLARPAAAAQAGGLDVRVGFAGAVRVGVPVPVRVAVSLLPEAGPASLVIDAPAMGPQAGPVTDTTVVPFEAEPGALQSFDVPVVLGNIRQPLVVRVLMAGREVARRVVPITPSLVGGRVVVTLSDEHAGLDSLSRLDERVVPAYADADALPHRWQEYGAVDLLVIRDLDPARLDDEQRDALATWVRLGGRLVVIVRQGVPAPAFLDDILPADAGDVRSLTVAGGAAASPGAAWPPGPYTVTALAPRPGATVTRLGGIPVIASAAVGLGWAAVWGVDPWQPPVAGWAGRQALWVGALGPPSRPLVNVSGVADLLPNGTPIGPGVHALVAGAIVAYLGVLYLIARRRAPGAGALASVGVVVIALAVFWLLAGDVRGRSTSVAEVTFFEAAPGTDAARALTVAVVSVPYGGPYRVRGAPREVVGPAAASGDLRATVADAGTVLEGTLPAGAEMRAFQSLALAQFAARAEITADGRTLTVDVGPEPVRRAELRWGARTYRLGDLPPGASTHAMDPSRWVSLTEIDSHAPVRAWIFQASTGDVIMNPTTPILVGEIPHTVLVFDLADGGTVDARPAILLLPVAGR